MQQSSGVREDAILKRFIQGKKPYKFSVRDFFTRVKITFVRPKPRVNSFLNTPINVKTTEGERMAWVDWGQAYKISQRYLFLNDAVSEVQKQLP